MMKKRPKFWLASMLLIYVAIAVAGFAIAYVIKTDFLPANQPVTAPTKPITNVTPIPILPDWKTYTNTTYQMRFSYPATDSIKTSTYGFGVTSLAFQTTKDNVLDFQILLLPKTLAQAVGQDFDAYYAMKDNTTKVIKSPLSNDNTTEKFTKLRNRSINGNQAIDYQSIASNAKPSAQPEIGTFIQVGNNLILISTGAGNKKNLEQLLKSFQYPL